MLCACKPRSEEQAQRVVAQADSLWQAGKMYGIDEGDSLTLAQAYETIGKEKETYADEYVHACYHYGRLLRKKEQPVEAMQCFINATHTSSHDYHILGRIYNNIGDMCHLAGEYQLSHDMFKKSADMFLCGHDTLSYYFCLNDMAYELAEQGKKEESMITLSQITQSCTDSDVIAKTWETKAEACLCKDQYDSVLYYSNLLYAHGNKDSNVILLRAKAYSFLEQKDSAVYYANYLLSISDKLSDKNSALYILTQYDESQDKQGIRTVAADRSDVQKLIEIRRSKYAQAVQLLDLDLHQVPDKRWVWTLISLVLFTLIAISLLYIWRKRKQHRHIIKDIRAKKKINSQLSNNIDNLTHLQELHRNEIITGVENSCQLFRNNQAINERLFWKDYNMMCEAANRYLYDIVNHLQPYHLSEKEVRLCILVLLKASTEQLVDLIPYAHSGIGKFKYTTARKLGTTTSNLRTFIINLLG